MKTIRIGVLSTAKIAREKVIPAMQKARHCKITAIASRDTEKAKNTALDLGIHKAYTSYEDLLSDPEIDAVYNPLPNHLHVQWSIRSLEAGKHVLCEKPIGMDAADARKLLAESQKYPRLKVMEAFMYRYHPRWKRTVELVKAGKIGDIKAVHSFFSYYNDDPLNYRNSSEMGGGGLMDVGCYSISVARLIFGRKPIYAKGISESDPDFKIDRLTSGIMDFGTGTSVFTCSTQCHKDQYVKIYGTRGKIELDWPFNPDFTKPTLLKAVIDDDISITEEFEPCDHFTLQADAFAKCILDDTTVPLPLQDSVENMEVIDQIKKSN
jgi:predicted dehydrogenase